MHQTVVCSNPRENQQPVKGKKKTPEWYNLYDYHRERILCYGNTLLFEFFKRLTSFLVCLLLFFGCLQIIAPCSLWLYQLLYILKNSLENQACCGGGRNASRRIYTHDNLARNSMLFSSLIHHNTEIMFHTPPPCIYLKMGLQSWNDSRQNVWWTKYIYLIILLTPKNNITMWKSLSASFWPS